MTYELSERRMIRWELKCDQCGFTAYSGQKHYAERRLQALRDQSCKHCAELARIDALPLHHRHQDGHSAAYGKPAAWFCCGAVQLGVMSMNDCAECGDPFPCAASQVGASAVPEGGQQ